MNTIGDVDLNAIPEEVLLSALSLPELNAQNFAVDQQQGQQHPLHAQLQAPQPPSQYAQHPHPQVQFAQQQHMQLQHPQEHQAFHQQVMHHLNQQQQQQQKQQQKQQQQQQQQQHSQNQYYPQNFGQCSYPMPPSYPYQSAPSPYHSGNISNLNSPSHSVRNSSADHPSGQNPSLSTMAPQTFPNPLSFSPTFVGNHSSPSSHIPSSPNSSNRRPLSRTVLDAGFNQSYRSLEMAPGQERQSKTRLSQSSDTTPHTHTHNASASQNSVNNNHFDIISQSSRPAFHRSDSLNSLGPPNKPVIPEMPWLYSAGNSAAHSMSQSINFQADALTSYSQGRSVVNNNSSNNRLLTNAAASLQSKASSNGANPSLLAYVDLDNPFIVSSSQRHTKSPQTSSSGRASNSASELLSNSGDELMKAMLLSSPSEVTQSQRNELSASKTHQVSNSTMNNTHNPSINAMMNIRHPHPGGNLRMANKPYTAATAPSSNQPRHPPPSLTSWPNVSQQSAMPAPSRARAPAPMRGAPPSRGSNSTRGGGKPPLRGAARGGPPPPPVTARDMGSFRGQLSSNHGAPSMRGAIPRRGVPTPTRGGPLTRGQPVRGGAPRGAPVRGGIPSGRGGSVEQGALSARGMPGLRGMSNSNRRGAGVSRRGNNTRGRGRAQPATATEFRGSVGMLSTFPDAERPVGNPIQWYRLPDTADASVAPSIAGFQSDIEAMRASMTSDARKSSTAVEQKQRQNSSGGQLKLQTTVSSSSQGNVRTENSSGTNIHVNRVQISTTKNQMKPPGKEAMIQLKQEIVDNPTPPIIRNERNTHLVDKSISNPTSQNTQPHQVKITSQNTPTNINRDETIPTLTHTRPSGDSSNKTIPTDSHQESNDAVVDRKPFIGAARDKVYSLWRAGQVVGRAPTKGKPKTKSSTASSTPLNQTQEKNQNDINIHKTIGDNVKNPSEISKRLVVDNPSSGPKKDIESKRSKLNNQAKTDKKNLFYVLFHGHKLICLSSGSSNAVLVCQFQYECFADKGKGMVSNCINKALRIKKRILDHPDKEVIIKFLRNNGYLKGILQNEPVHVMSLDDARRVYHFIYNIKNCSIATCVVEVLNQSVDLNIVISPSKRKILTQEMKMRIKREKKQVDDERYGRLHPPQLDSHTNNSGTPSANANRFNGKKKHHSTCSDRSDQTLAYGNGEEDEDLDDVVIVEGPEDPYLLKWDGKQSKPGCVCNTIVGQVRSYHHEGDNYLVVSDLCRILGTSEFMTGIETDNVILYSCTKDILSFLNELSLNFPQLDTGQNCLVKEKDVGVHATDEEDGDPNPTVEVNRIAPLKRPLCKQEVVEDDEDKMCSNSKQRRISNNVRTESSASLEPSLPDNSTVVSSSRTEKRQRSQDKVLDKTLQHVPGNSTSDNSSPRVTDNDEGDSNVIIVFDTNSINKSRDKFSETPLNMSDPKSKENSKDQKSMTGLSSPDSCLSVFSQDGPQSPGVLRQHKDLSQPTQPSQNNSSVSVNESQITNDKAAVSVVDEISKDLNNTNNGPEMYGPSKPQSLSDNSINIPATMSKANEATQSKKVVVATVIDINSLTNKTSNTMSTNKQAESDTSAAQDKQLPTGKGPGVNKAIKATQLANHQDLLSRISSSKGLPVLKRKCVEDDLELSKLHVTSMEGLEEYRSRGSLLKEMEVLRFKNKTLQETLKALRDQLKKSKAEQEKSDKLATYYGSVIQEITATFKDGDKVEPGGTYGSTSQKILTTGTGKAASPICIDDDD